MQILLLLIFSSVLSYGNQKTVSPHGSGLKISCNVCHSSKGWQLDKDTYSFNHNKTRLPLLGQHKVTNCRECHPALIFTGTKSNCNDCHPDIHQATLGLECSRCHTPVSWLVNNIIDLHQTSRFPLVGAHRTADCVQCHKSENYTRQDILGVNCIDCHRQSYLATTTPNHIQSGISEDCIQCHKVSSFQWTGTGFDHSTFPLVSGHSTVKCTDCHTQGNYTSANPACFSCHQNDFLAAKNPVHVPSVFSNTCQDCHSLSPGWKPVTFNHSAFPLTLGHAVPACVDCHKNGNYASTPIDCYFCHQADYTSTQAPNHLASGYSTLCANCHSINPGWKPAAFNHSTFPLTLGHSTPLCVDCHKNANYATTSAVCYSCHQTDFTSAANPNHTTSGFSTTCTICHTTTPGWKPVTFIHTTFPLTLGHATPLCADCHIGGNYTTTSIVCYSCHAANYNNSTNPKHSTLSFSTTCTQCHTTVPGWKPASYTQHDAQFFPVYSGKHKGAWTLCSECHTNVANYALYDCKRCHTSAHRSNNYSSAQCYNCHPKGTTR